MLTIWGRRNSTNVQKVMWTVGELGLDHEHRNVGGSFGGTDTAEYRAMNPMGLVPTVRDGDIAIFESNAIVRYLAARYGVGTLWPEDPAERARADQWMEWAQTVIGPPITAVFWGIARTPEAKQDMEALKPAIDKLGRLLAIADERLGEAAFLGGERLTFGDVPLGTTAYRYFTLPIERPSLPNLERWYEALTGREAYRTHVMIPFGASLEEWQALEAKLT